MALVGDIWDFIVVGGGSAGCVLASRLSEDPAARVLLLDAGRSDSHPYSRIPAAVGLAFSSREMNWSYLAEPDPSRGNRRDIWPAGKLLGGGSSINGMMFVRGNAWDYDHWRDLGNVGWGYSDVLPYFRRLENNERGANEFRGGAGPQSVADARVHHPLTDAFVEAMVELGVPRNMDLNGATQEGVDYCQLTQKNGVRHSAASAYLAPVRSRQNLEVRLGAAANRVEIQDGCARSVSYVQRGVTHRAVTRRGIVIASGALATPKLLMLSGIGPAEHLRSLGIEVVCELPGVGQNLQEHPGMIVSPRVDLPTLTSDLGPRAIIRESWRFLTRRRGALTQPVGNAHAFVRTRPNLDAPNVQIIFSPTAFDHHETGVTVHRGRATSLAVGLCRVRSRGSVRLRTKNPQDCPVIDYALLSDPDDLAQLAEGVEMARRLYQTASFARHFRGERVPGDPEQSRIALLDFIRRHSFLMYHACGTCRMGDDPLAVVGADLKVRGVRNLWVADASIMPTLPAGNINASCLMIGEKASDLIRGV